MTYILEHGIKIISILIFYLFSSITHAQNLQQDTLFKPLMTKAQKHFNRSEWELANVNYEKAFAIEKGNYFTGFFNNGYSYIQRSKYDSAYIYLLKAHQSDWENFYYKAKSTRLWDRNTLQFDKLRHLRDSSIQKYATLDSSLIHEMSKILFLDQLYRGFVIDSVRSEFGRGSIQDELVRNIRNEQDQALLQNVEKIILKYGYPGVSLVGKKYSTAAFLVIQHSDIPTMSKYLPILKALAQKKELPISTVALMEDRVLLGEGKKQLYGTQIMTYDDGKSFVRPIEDPDNLDIRRAAIGLKPMAEYVIKWKIIWNVEDFKKEMQLKEDQEKANKSEHK